MPATRKGVRVLDKLIGRSGAFGFVGIVNNNEQPYKFVSAAIRCDANGAKTPALVFAAPLSPRFKERSVVRGANIFELGFQGMESIDTRDVAAKHFEYLFHMGALRANEIRDLLPAKQQGAYVEALRSWLMNILKLPENDLVGTPSNLSVFDQTFGNSVTVKTLSPAGDVEKWQVKLESYDAATWLANYLDILSKDQVKELVRAVDRIR